MLLSIGSKPLYAVSTHLHLHSPNAKYIVNLEPFFVGISEHSLLRSTMLIHER